MITDVYGQKIVLMLDGGLTVGDEITIIVVVLHPLVAADRTWQDEMDRTLCIISLPSKHPSL